MSLDGAHESIYVGLENGRLLVVHRACWAGGIWRGIVEGRIVAERRCLDSGVFFTFDVRIRCSRAVAVVPEDRVLVSGNDLIIL